MTLKEEIKNSSLSHFLEVVNNDSMFWVIKRLSGNDTGLTGGHQVGVYYPKSFFQKAFPEIIRTDLLNPKETIRYCYFPNAQTEVNDLQTTYYNNRFFGGTRNELRITSWGGRQSPTNDPEKTGSIFILVIKKEEDGTVSAGWVAESLNEEFIIEEWLGEEVEPGRFYMQEDDIPSFQDIKIPDEWLEVFPTGEEIFKYILNLIPQKSWNKSLDSLLLKRRDREYEIYKCLEEHLVFPIIKRGFDSVDGFLKLALSVANRRKSRTGKSLELNLEAIFREESLYFESQAVTENGKKPDFIFPSKIAYHDKNFPSEKLKLVAAKTTCKDRWRQVLDEAERIKTKHLFTLQQGVSVKQLTQMSASNVQLVVPTPYISSYPKEWRDRILTLELLVDHIKHNQMSIRNIDKWIA